MRWSFSSPLWFYSTTKKKLNRFVLFFILFWSSGKYKENGPLHLIQKVLRISVFNLIFLKRLKTYQLLFLWDNPIVINSYLKINPDSFMTPSYKYHQNTLKPLAFKHVFKIKFPALLKKSRISACPQCLSILMHFC